MRKSRSSGPVTAKFLWPLLIPILLLLPGLTAFSFPSPDANYSDLSLTHYPNAVFLERSITEWGQIPLWSPTIMSGYPFAANPLSGLWYPPGWLALLFPLPLGFNVLVIAHLLAGGLGMYLFIRALGRSHEAALFGAAAFEALPKVLAHYGAGHLTMVYAISLTPWLLLAEARSWQPSGNFWFRQPGIVLGLIALADPRWAAYAGLLWVAFSLVAKEQTWRRKMAAVIKQTLLAIALAGPLLLPLLEYSQLSTRADLAPADLLAFSLPPAALLGFLAPQLGGFHEWIIYVGVGALMFAIIAIVSTHKHRLDRLWIGIAIFAIIFSLGEHIPGFAQIAQLPGISFLRVPPRILPLTGIALILLAASSLDALLNKELSQQIWRRIRLAIAGILGLQAGLAITVWLLTQSFPAAYLWGFVIGSALLVGLILFSTKRMSTSWLWASALMLTLVDLMALDVSLFVTRVKDEVLAEGSEVAEYLSQQPGQFRVYSPSYSIPQQTAAAYRLELADGVDPLQLQTYVDIMEQATGVQSIGYSITLPPFVTSDPSEDNKNAVSDLRKLALLNVAYVASEFELDVEGLDLIDRFGETYLYQLVDGLPRAFIEGALRQLVTIAKWTPNRIEIRAEGPGRLVLSELIYPGWVAEVNGDPAQIEPYEQILRSVQLTEGTHEIVFEFRPTSVYVGLALFFVAMSILVCAWRWQRPAKK